MSAVTHLDRRAADTCPRCRGPISDDAGCAVVRIDVGRRDLRATYECGSCGHEYAVVWPDTTKYVRLVQMMMREVV